MTEVTMPPDALHELNRQIGLLLGGVDGLRRDLQASDLKSDRSRADMHRRLDDLVDQAAEIETTVSVIGTRLAAVEATIKDRVMPTVGRVEAWEQRGIGAIAAVGLVSGTMGAILMAFWQEIFAKLTRTG